jgi:Ca-activated chloride channel homolog
MTGPGRVRLAKYSAFLIAAAVGCGRGERPAPEATGGRPFTILAGSELKDVEPLFGEIQSRTGVRLVMTYSGTLAGIDRLQAGERFDAVWFSHAKYLILSDSGHGRIRAQEKIMLSPVVLGVKESKARAWGWVDNPKLTWADIAARVHSGELHYAMTNPAASNSGFSAVVGVASALSKTGSALRASDVDSKALHDFFQGQTLTAGSSGWLADGYVRDQDRLDGMVNYESILLSLNRSGRLREKLVLVYPKEGIVTADYPLVLLNEQRRADYDSVVALLRSTPFQQELMTSTFRRPAIPDLAPDTSLFPNAVLVELPFPNDLSAINRILFSFLNDQRRPAHAFYLLDLSGSMKGQRLSQLQSALHTLAGDDASLTGQFARFQAREHVTVLPFSSEVEARQDYRFSDSAASPETLAEVRRYADGLQAGGATAIYSSLEEAYRQALAAHQADSTRYYSIMLLTDGENTRGESADDFEAFYRSLPAEARSIRTFPIIFGEADRSALTHVAELTGGRVFDGNSGSLAAVFKEIRGYQ